MLISGDNLKILGFTFGRIPNVSAQIEGLVGKFSRSIWIICNLKKAGLEKKTLVRSYVLMMRPIVEFSCNIYGPMINGG